MNQFSIYPQAEEGNQQIEICQRMEKSILISSSLLTDSLLFLLNHNNFYRTDNYGKIIQITEYSHTISDYKFTFDKKSK